METQLDRRRRGASWAALGVALFVSGCAAVNGEAPERFPGSSGAEDWCIGVSKLTPELPLPRKSAPSAKPGEQGKSAAPALGKQRLGDRVQVPFPSAVGGFDWWQTTVEFRATCRDADGAANREDMNALVCSRAPVEGLPVSVDLATGTFCHGLLCAMSLVFYRGDIIETYDEVLSAIVAKYGEPQAAMPQTDAPTCWVAGERSANALYWFWETSTLSLSVRCAANGPTVELTYLTEAALKWGEEQNRRRQESF